MKTANKNAHKLTETLTPFTGSNLYALKGAKTYTVYSYGSHFPLFHFDGEKWFENTVKYSQTTGRHRTHARPRNVQTIPVNNLQKMKDIVQK